MSERWGTSPEQVVASCTVLLGLLAWPELQAGEAGGMSAECGEPGPEGPQGPSPGPGGLPGASGLGQCPPRTTSTPWSLPLWRAHAAAAVLCYVNLLNYMHWFIIPGVLLDVQKFFEISDSCAGLLQTALGCGSLQGAMQTGPFTDAGLPVILGFTGVLCLPAQYSWLFFLSRGVVGTGSASYSTIAPTILGDLFVRDQRTRVLAIFYIFIPVGSGLGYMLGSAVLQLTGNWRWALRVMPCLEAVALVLLIVLVPDPPRGAAEKQEEVATGGPRSSWWEDVRYLGRNWSFVWSTLGVTAIAFVTGALGFWAPKFLFEARVVHGLQRPCLQEPCSSQDSLIFGALTVVTGIIGVVLGAEASRRYKRVNPRAEPLLCTGSLLAAAPCLYLALILAPTTFLASYVLLALGELLLSCNWAVVADILLYVVIPTRRATAVALQSFTSHLLGDAGSPYLIGFISDLIRQSTKDSPLWEFLSLGYALMLCPFVVVLGGMFFLATALFFLGDRAKAEQQVNQLVMPPAPVKV
ncbi:protein spinster homolog 3-like [Puma concolor]|uniref:Protein spinster homolog 3-like n=1 Tax=Puma concolor TaxID=9696 RepID=A0A6P6HJU5_PUMCO|nr:protein spinster homolog 3-like [Puma concolor]